MPSNSNLFSARGGALDGSIYPAIGLALLAFAVYALAASAQNAERASRWSVETDFSLPAAISYSVYGAPIGMAERAVYQAFRGIPREAPNKSLREVIARTAVGDMPRRGLIKTNTDGTGASYPIFASVAMRLFGPKLRSLTELFLLLVGISTLAYVCRFRDDRLFYIPLLFLGLTLPFLSVTADEDWLNQMPIGGYRYFTVAGLLPALHIFFEITGRPRQGAKTLADLLLLGLQALLLTFVIMVRSSAGYMLGLLMLALLYRGWTSRQRSAELRKVAGKVGLVLLLAITLVVGVRSAVPDYAKAGRVFGNFWHRSVVSLGLHPEWPFGNLREVYDCSDVYPEGLSGKVPDRDGACIFWTSYPPAVAGKIADADFDDFYFSGVSEKVLRAAFFDIALSYPRQIVETYLYYKSAAIVSTLLRVLQFDWLAQGAFGLITIVLQLAIFCTFIAWLARQKREDLMRNDQVLFGLLLLSLLPLYAAWSNLSTSIDTIALAYASAGIGISRVFLSAPPRTLRLQLPDVRYSKAVLAGFLFICVGGGWTAYRVLAAASPQSAIGGHEASPGRPVQALPPAAVPTQGSELAELPAPTGSAAGPDRWDFIVGLKAEAVETPVVAAGQRVLQLIAAGANRHALGAQYRRLDAGGIYRTFAWVKAEPGVRAMVEIRDRRATSYGVVRVDLEARTIMGSTGDVLASGVEAAGNGWLKVWADLRSNDGQLFVMFGLLGTRASRTEFAAAGQKVIFGGFEISPGRAM